MIRKVNPISPPCPRCGGHALATPDDALDWHCTICGYDFNRGDPAYVMPASAAVQVLFSMAPTLAFSALPLLGLLQRNSDLGGAMLTIGFLGGLASVVLGPLLTQAILAARRRSPRLGRCILLIALNAVVFVAGLYVAAHVLAGLLSIWG